MLFKLPSITVYESEPTRTESVPSCTCSSTPPVGLDGPIEIIETDFKSIVQKFNRVMLIIDDNFDGEMPKIHVEPNKIEFDETVIESLKRLQTEFEDLKQQFDKDSEDLDSTHVESLELLLDQAKDKLLASASINPNLNVDEMNEFVDTDQQAECALVDLVKMSERLTTISRVIGQHTDLSKRFTQPLDFVVEEFSLQLDEVPSNTNMNEQLNVALNDYNKLNKDDNAHKINDIYDTLNCWNNECQALPLILERLRHCAALSEQAKHILKNKLDILTAIESCSKALNFLDSSTAQRSKLKDELVDLQQTVDSL